MLGSLLIVCGLIAASPAPANETGADALKAYEIARERVGRDPSANLKMALWCEAHGLQPERMKHLALTVLVDPSNAMARGLMGLVSYQGQWKRPEVVAGKVKSDEALTARLAEYNSRRAKTPDKADAQWSLALWCEQNDLNAEALAHFTAVTRLDPTRDAAWKRLGYKKAGHRWVTDAQLTAEKLEADAQKKADKLWTPLLLKLRASVDTRARHDSATTSLASITDPRAVSSIWSVFVVGKPSNHALAVQLLGQIDAAASSRALAFLAVFDPSAEIRRSATETLKRRDPREFAGMLVAMLRDPIKYEVKPVGGPGSPGAIFVVGERFNVQRIYSPPPAITQAYPGQYVGLDAFGIPVAVREFEFDMPSGFGLTSPALAISGFMADIPAADQAIKSFAGNPHNAQAIFQNYQQAIHTPSTPGHPNPSYDNTVFNQQLAATRGMLESRAATMIAEAQKVAETAGQQLHSDINNIDTYNKQSCETNESASQVLTAISGQSLGSDRKAWSDWYTNQLGYANVLASQTTEKPTFVEQVSINYQPPNIGAFSYDSARGYTAISCFGAGTLVRTLDGSKPIESIQVGDRVLTQDVHSGALGYHPVTVVHHNPPSPTFLVKVGADTIVSSPFHRFWIAGKGWIMARDLKGGETLRLLDGPAQVESVESGPVQLVYNLDVADAHDFFAGSAAALVHDNTLPETRLAPFDAPPELASTAK